VKPIQQGCRDGRGWNADARQGHQGISANELVRIMSQCQQCRHRWFGHRPQAAEHGASGATLLHVLIL
jgi:hypothetical protein